MHRSKEIYGEDANEFRPERWEGQELKNIGWGFMPFHGGPRICLGSKFKLMAVGLFIMLIIACRRLRSYGSFVWNCSHPADLPES